LCIFAYGEPKTKEVKLFLGRTDGEIVKPRGPNSFGYIYISLYKFIINQFYFLFYSRWDPCFLPKNFQQTYAEMTKETKNSISHRFKAIDSLREYLKNN
jgi:inosine triphosphate pyrophosphatase